MRASVLIFAVTMSVTSVDALAGCEGFTCSGKIADFAESLKVTTDEQFIVLRRDGDNRPMSCDLINTNAVQVPFAKGNRPDTFYSMLLTAFAANSDVVIQLDGTNRQCVISSVDLIPSS